MYKKIMIFVMAMLLVSTTAFGHVMNQNNVFEDLALTEAADQVVLLSALGIVSYLDGSYEFKPNDKLTAKDLAAWVASYYGLQGETSDELAQVALQHKLISTIDGEATYRLVNEVYFHGQLTLENSGETMTREEFALFVVNNVQMDLEGYTLLNMSNYIPGPTGKIEYVERVKKQTTEGGTAYVYLLTIEGMVYELGMHPRVIADSTDPSIWIGQTISASFYGPNVSSDHLGKHSDHHEAEHTVNQDMSSAVVNEMAVQFLVIGDESFTITAGTIEQITHETEDVATSLLNVDVKTEKDKSSNTWIYVALLIVVFGISVFMWRRKRRV